jgi:hypothetical protein
VRSFSISGSFLDAKSLSSWLSTTPRGLAMVTALEIERLVLGGVDMDPYQEVIAPPLWVGT